MLKPGRILKPYMPKSLFWRAFLILAVPILLLQTVVALVFAQRHYEGVTEQMAGSVARRINFAIDRVDNAADLENLSAELRELSRSLDIALAFREAGGGPEPDRREAFDLTGAVIAETLRDGIRNPVSLDFTSRRKRVVVRVFTGKGVLEAAVNRQQMNASNPHLLLVWMMLTALALTAVATTFLRNQIRPIRELAKTATAFGRGRSEPFRPAGAEEIRRAGCAFLDMRNRIERQIEQRTRMLSGVSHDLRTPLTRMRLALAVIEPSPETEELARDAAEMEHMLDAFLDFARGADRGAFEPCDPLDIARDVVRNARREGRTVADRAQIETPENPLVALRKAETRRCLANLVGNAFAYGDRVSLTTRLTETYLEFVVEDDGPGIPPDKREDALKPFTRLDESRNQNIASGVGLGLSIALDIARGQGGSLKLETSERLGGLAASVILPR